MLDHLTIIDTITTIQLYLRIYQYIMDMNTFNVIKQMRYKLDIVMNQVDLLDDKRLQITLRMHRAMTHNQQSVRYMHSMQLLTTCNVLKMYRRFMMKTWHSLEGLEDDLLEMGYDQDEANVIVWGNQ